MADTVEVPRQWLIKVFDTLTTIEGLLDGNKPVNPKKFGEALASDIDWVATAANVMLLETEGK